MTWIRAQRSVTYGTSLVVVPDPWNTSTFPETESARSSTATCFAPPSEYASKIRKSEPASDSNPPPEMKSLGMYSQAEKE